MVVYHLAKSFVNSGKCSKFSERLERYSKVSNLNFPTENVFSPVPSPTPHLICVTCYVIGVVQMVHANPDRNFSLGIFTYHLYKPSTNRFSHANGKQPKYAKFAVIIVAAGTSQILNSLFVVKKPRARKRNSLPRRFKLNRKRK